MIDRRLRSVVALLALSGGWMTTAHADRDDDDRRRPSVPQLHHARNDSGVATTISTNGFIDTRNPFFRPLGSNERSCFTCHQPQDGWSITPKSLRERFEDTRGTDPVFRLVDGANSPKADVSTYRAREQVVQHAAEQGADPDRPADPGHRAVRARRRRRPVRLRERDRALALSPSARQHQPALPQHGHVGRPRDAARRDVEPLHLQHDDLLRAARRRSHDAGERRGPDARQGTVPLTAAQREAIVDFELGLVTAQSPRRQGRPAHRPRRARRPGEPAGRDLVLRHQRHAGRRLQDPRELLAGGDDALQGLAVVHRGRAPATTRRTATAASPSRAAAIARGEALFNSKPIAHHRRQGTQRRPQHRRHPAAPARPATTRPTPATTRCRCRSTSASTDASRRTRRPAALHAAQQDHRPDRADERSGPGAHHRAVEGHRPLQGADAARPRVARAVLPQRLREGPARGRQVLQRPLQHRLHRPGEAKTSSPSCSRCSPATKEPTWTSIIERPRARSQRVASCSSSSWRRPPSRSRRRSPSTIVPWSSARHAPLSETATSMPEATDVVPTTVAASERGNRP